MANQYRGNITKFEVQDGSRKATVEGNWAPLPPNTTPHPGPFRLTSDSDNEFLAMCAICAGNTWPGAFTVTITPESGSPDQIDILSVP
jgi:hypothetical protein